MNIGDILHERYELETILGQGGMGVTYKARDLHTQQYVAVKRLLFSQMQEWKPLEMFEREAAILRQLDHPRIPKYLDYFTLETSSDLECVLVQEYIEGVTLQERIEQGWRGTEAECLAIFRQIVEILAYLHALQPPVIHRDLNPHNIMLNERNEAFLIDFGAVQEIIRATMLGGSTIVGTFGYIPFEQFAGKALPASDYYAAGATLLHMLTHRQPSDFQEASMEIKLPSDLNLSANVRRLLEGLLASSADTRLASQEDVNEILDARLRSTRIQPQDGNLKKKVSRSGKVATYSILGRRSREMRFVLGLSAAILFFFGMTLLSLSWESASQLPRFMYDILSGDDTPVLYFATEESEILGSFIAWYILPLSVIPLTGIAIRLLARCFMQRYAQTELIVSPTRLNIVEKTFGGITRSLRFNDIEAMRLTSFSLKNGRQEPIIEFRAGKKRATINVAPLNAVERNLLLEELRNAVRHYKECGGKEPFPLNALAWSLGILLLCVVSVAIVVNNQRNHPPQITSTPPAFDAAALEQEDGYAYRIEAFDPDRDDIRIELVKTPEGMRLGNQWRRHVPGKTPILRNMAIITWKPTFEQVGKHDVEIRVTDERGASATQMFSLTIDPKTFDVADVPDIEQEFDLSAHIGEGVDVETGTVERDPTVLTLGVNDLSRITDFIEVENMFTFSKAADFYFGYKDGKPIFTPQPGVSNVLLTERPYDTVSANILTALEFDQQSGRTAMTPEDTMIFKTAEGHIYKLGNVYKNVFEGAFNFDYQELIP